MPFEFEQIENNENWAMRCLVSVLIEYEYVGHFLALAYSLNDCSCLMGLSEIEFGSLDFNWLKRIESSDGS